MSKALLYASSVRPGGLLHEELLEGAAQMALAVGSTLGPRGRNVIIERLGDEPITTKDGVTVAENIQLTNPVHNAAAKMIRAVAKATVDEAGDGTTTATVLAHAIFRKGLDLVAGRAYTLRGPQWVHDALPFLERFPFLRRRYALGSIALQRSIGAAVDAVNAAIRSSAIEPTDEQIAQVATISTNGNAEIGRLIQQAIAHVGRSGMITLDDSDKPSTWLEIRPGFQFDSGWTAPDFVTDKTRGTAVLEHPLIFLTERLLTQGLSGNPTLHDLGNLLNYCAGLDPSGTKLVREARPLLLIAEDFAGDAAQTLTVNHNNQRIQLCCVRAPGAGDLRRASLSDLALATGGQVLTMDSGQTVSKWVLEGAADNRQRFTGKRLGSCARAVVTNGRTILEGCPGDVNDPDLVASFAAGLIGQAEAAQEPRAREYLLQRAARLTGQVAVLRVGAATKAEARALRDLVEDAVLAVRAALAEGIVPGGGLCLYALSSLLLNHAASMPPLAAAGATLLAQCMREPLRLIATNAGIDPDEACAEVDRHSRAGGGFGVGLNAATGAYEPLVAAGIVDPAKVVRVALEKSASIAALMLTSSCLIYFDPAAQRMPPGYPVPPSGGRA